MSSASSLNFVKEPMSVCVYRETAQALLYITEYEYKYEYEYEY